MLYLVGSSIFYLLQKIYPFNLQHYNMAQLAS